MTLAMWTPEIIALVVATFLFAGFVKGVVGFGLPVVALALMAPTIGIKAAIALNTMPIIIINIWQAASGGNFLTITRRLWSFLLLAGACIWFGVSVLATVKSHLTSGALGALLAVYAGYSLARSQLRPPADWEFVLNPVVGALGGFVFGMTGSFMVPGVIYLQALGFNRNMLVQSLGISFLLISVVLTLSLSSHNLLDSKLGTLSAIMIVPALAGMFVGQRFRHRLSEELFRKYFFWALLVSGLYMVLRVFV